MASRAWRWYRRVTRRLRRSWETALPAIRRSTTGSPSWRWSSTAAGRRPLRCRHRPTVTCRVWNEESEAHDDPLVWETWDGAKRHFCYRYKVITGHSLRPGDIQLFNREVHLEQNNRAVPEIGRWLNGDTEAQRATGEGSFRITARVTDVYIARDARTPRRAGQAPY